MTVNFQKLSADLKKNINPLEIFMTELQKSPKYSYLRNVQSEVLELWHENRESKDSIIKMNTGSGKTTVALLILKSCLNENRGRSVYVVADNYLVEQVIREAGELGVPVTRDESDLGFISGNTILVINIHKLFNGRSVFGVNVSTKIKLDYILIDDVHACVDDVKNQFTLQLSNEKTEASKELFCLFAADLKEVSESIYLDISEGYPNSRNIMVPFWKVNERKSAILKILQSHQDDEDLKFKFPFFTDILDYCNFVFTARGVEIEPYCVPINKISSFSNAKKRFFMSATLSDDSQLISTFDIDSSTIKEAITPNFANDIGDRMILFPQAYDKSITDDDVKNRVYEYSKRVNVVVLVPSYKRANYWTDVTSNIYSASNIKEGIKLIQSRSNGLYILINKYDGIDLPNDNCRIIVLDGIPDCRSEYERVLEELLQDTADSFRSKIQKIEQGMGRGVRSSNDYCGVIIMGAKLVNLLYDPTNRNFFSIATNKQLEASDRLVKTNPTEDIFSFLDYCVECNKEWLQYSKGFLSNLKYNKKINIESMQVALRRAFNEAVNHNNYDKAQQIITEEINNTDDPIKKGFLLFEKAKYCHKIDVLGSQKILVAANKYNHNIRPMDRIRVITKKENLNQSQNIYNYIKDIGVEKYFLDIKEVIDSLVFAEDSYTSFEKAFEKLGKLLGFSCDRYTDGIGPDVVWYLGELKYAVIECKNEAKATTIRKTYCAQLASSVNWFKINYQYDCTCIPVIVHPSCVFDKTASPGEDFCVINEEKLDLMKKSLTQFTSSICNNNNYSNLESINQLLKKFNFSGRLFFQAYSTKGSR